MSLPSITLETLEAVSSIAMTVMSTIVAAVALVFSYRQNAGWKPVALIVGQSMGSSHAASGFEFGVDIEVWNRRRYPIVLRGINVSVQGFDLKDRKPPPVDNGPYIRGNRLSQKLSKAVKPGDQFHIRLPFAFEYESLDAMRPMFTIELLYFDPQSGKERRLRILHRHFYPDLGWKLSKAQRDEAKQRHIASRKRAVGACDGSS